MKKTQDTRPKFTRRSDNEGGTQDAGRNPPVGEVSPLADEPRNRSPRRSIAKPGNRFTNRRGVTLPEMMVVIAIVALLVGLTIPAMNMLFNSFESQSGAQSMISAALASARAIAAKEQRYAGIRFQKRYDPKNPDPINAPQYIIFIIHDYDNTKLANGFRAVEGIQPIKLPDSIGVMDLLYHTTLPPGDGVVDTEAEISDVDIFRDTTTFSIVFSPSGKLVIHDVRARNRDGHPLWVGVGLPLLDDSWDDIFNTITWIAQRSMFLQDDYSADGLYEEPSRNRFIIYETKKFKEARAAGIPWSGYLNSIAVKPVYINAYTGAIINE